MKHLHHIRMQNVENVLSAERYESLARNTKNKLIIVEYIASWCAYCEKMSPIFDDLSSKYPNVIFARVDIERLKTDEGYTLTSFPTFIFFRDMKEITRMSGASANTLEKTINSLIT